MGFWFIRCQDNMAVMKFQTFGVLIKQMQLGMPGCICCFSNDLKNNISVYCYLAHSLLIQT